MLALDGEIFENDSITRLDVYFRVGWSIGNCIIDKVVSEMVRFSNRIIQLL